MKTLNIPGCKYNAVLVILFVSIMFLPLISDAHRIKVHEKITREALKIMIRDAKNDQVNNYIEFLNTEVTGLHNTQGLTYLDILIKGTKDADLRVNGIYAIDCHCRPEGSRCDDCSEKNKQYNDFKNWPVGDHGYYIRDRKGFISNPDDSSLRKRVTDLIENKPDNERIKKLLSAVGSRERLENLLETSNARDMAIFFKNQARKHWRTRNFASAMYNLGIALHLLQDMSVPHHALHLNSCDETISSHCGYEKFIEEKYINSSRFQVGDVTGDYSHDASQMMTHLDDIGFRIYCAASSSMKFDLDAKKSIGDSLKLALSASAGMLYYYLDFLILETKSTSDRRSERALPPLPYIEKNAHPFEGAQYGVWTSKENIPVYPSPDSSKKLIATIPKGMKFRALTGETHLQKPRVLVVRTTMIVWAGIGSWNKVKDYFKLKINRGDRLYLINYYGEGVAKFIYKGKTYILGHFGMDYLERVFELEKLKRSWWIKVQLNNNIIGWVENPNVSGADAFE